MSAKEPATASAKGATKTAKKSSNGVAKATPGADLAPEEMTADELAPGGSLLEDGPEDIDLESVSPDPAELVDDADVLADAENIVPDELAESDVVADSDAVAGAGAAGDPAVAPAEEPEEPEEESEPSAGTSLTSGPDFVWDEEESEALRQARKDAELTASADSVRAYLKQIGKVALLNAEEEVELAKRIEAGLYAAERVRRVMDHGEKVSPQLAP